MYGITRIDNDTNKTHSWHVTISRRGIQYTKHFSDGVYRGKRKALNAAKEYKDSIVSKHPHYKKKDICSIVLIFTLNEPSFPDYFKLMEGFSDLINRDYLLIS